MPAECVRKRLRASYRSQRFAGPCRGAARRLAPHHLQPHSRRAAADDPHAGRIAARAARLGARTTGSHRADMLVPPPAVVTNRCPLELIHDLHRCSPLACSSVAARSSGRGVRVRLAAARGRAGAAPPRTRARLSADLADHLAAGSQTIDVIVHGDAGRGRRAGGALQPDDREAVSARAAPCSASTPVSSTALQQDERGRSPVGRHPDPVVGRRGGAESIGADQVWAGRDERAGADRAAASRWR